MKTTFVLIILFFALACLAQQAVSSPRLVEITADRDSRFRIRGKADPVLEVHAGERLLLRISATRAKEVARDGSVHGFVMVDSDGRKIAGWAFSLKPGLQQFDVTAPLKPGEYTVYCTVICSDRHEEMTMKVVVIRQEGS